MHASPASKLFPDVPPMNLNQIAKALKAVGVTLVSVSGEITTRCDACGYEYSQEFALDDRLPRQYYVCGRCTAEVEEEDPA